MHNKYIHISLIITLILIVFLSEPLQASQPYTLEASNINYDYQAQKVYASQDIVFNADSISITAEKLVIDIDKDTAIADGKVVLTTPEQKIRGKHLEYNYKNESGKFYGAKSSLDDLKFKGKLIKITDQKEYKYIIQDAAFTPCILETPHYQLKAESVKIYPGDKILGEKISFWWGKVKLIQLPFYVMKYKEGSNGGELQNSFPLPRLGYNSEQGIIMELNYNYQLNKHSDGNVFVSLDQAGGKKVKVDNIYNVKKNLTLKSLYNYDKVIEDDEKEDIEEVFSTILSYKLNNNYSFNSKYKYEKEIEDGMEEIDNLYTVGLKYNKKNVYVDSIIGYNFSQNRRQEEISIDYDINQNSVINIYSRFFDETLNRYSYKLLSSQPLNWQLIYRDGYETDYSPYLKLSLPKFAGVNTKLELGRVTADNITVDKAHINLAFNKTVNPLTNLYFSWRENYVVDFYNSPDNRFHALTSVFKSKYEHVVNKNIKLSGELQFLKTVTGGKYLLEDDEIEEEESAQTSLSVEILTPQPQSAWILNNNNKYNLIDNEWDNINLKVIRRFDCYSLEVNYDWVDKSYEFSINL